MPPLGILIALAFCSTVFCFHKALSPKVLFTARLAASDSDSEDCPSDAECSFVPFDKDGIKKDILTLISQADRGADQSYSSRIKDLASDLEKSIPAGERAPGFINGKWELLWSDDDLTRVSPFFWAFRKATKDIRDPTGLLGSDKISESIFKITDNIPFRNIGQCWQTFSDNNLVSEVVVEVGLKSSFALASSTMTTTSTWKHDDQDPQVIEVSVEKTQVLDSTIEKLLPFSPPFIGPSSSFPSGSAFELIRPGSSTVYMRNSYVDEDFRVARNMEDGKIFIFERASY